MDPKTKLLLAGWLIALVRLAILVWQMSLLGRGADWVFNTGVVMLIVGNVLRVYARYTPMKRKAGRKSRDDRFAPEARDPPLDTERK